MTARLSQPFGIAALALTLVAGSCGGASPTAPAPSTGDSPQAHLDLLLDLMEAHSVHRETIDWTDLRARVMTEAAEAQTIPDAFPAIRTALTLLGDRHSVYIPASGGSAIFASRRNCEAPAPPVPDVPGGIGYVKVTGFVGTADESRAFANDIQNTLRANDRDGLLGWIVDLRGNGGGNMWPMIAGLGPVVGEGLLGYFLSPAGASVAWTYVDGVSYSGGAVGQRVTDPYELRQPRPRVAVLIDRRVGSSGEATAIAFKGRAATRFFGTGTCGVSTANTSIGLSNGATLILTVALMADRTRTLYGDVVEPDEVIADPSAAVERAVAWLRGE